MQANTARRVNFVIGWIRSDSRYSIEFVVVRESIEKINRNKLFVNVHAPAKRQLSFFVDLLQFNSLPLHIEDRKLRTDMIVERRRLMGCQRMTIALFQQCEKHIRVLSIRASTLSACTSKDDLISTGHTYMPHVVFFGEGVYFWKIRFFFCFAHEEIATRREEQ